jgi:hypothetical protein
MFVGPIFKAAMSATPWRKDFYAKLGDDAAAVKVQLEAWLGALQKLVDILKVFLAKKENKW